MISLVPKLRLGIQAREAPASRILEAGAWERADVINVQIRSLVERVFFYVNILILF